MAQNYLMNCDYYYTTVVFQFDLSHDRFLIIDESEIYHLGASLKDLAKKWFAFSKLEHSSFGLMQRINAIIQSK